MDATSATSIARRVALRFCGWGCLWVFACASIPFGGPQNTVLFAAQIPVQVAVGVTVLVVSWWLLAPLAVGRIGSHREDLLLLLVVVVFELAVVLASASSLLLIDEPITESSVGAYVGRPLFWMSFLGLLPAVVIGFFFLRALGRELPPPAG